MLVCIIVVWSLILLAVVCMSVRWLPSDHCMFVKRGAMTVRMKHGLNFLIPFYDRVIGCIVTEGRDIILCNFSVDADSYQIRGTYKISDEFQDVGMIDVLQKFPDFVAEQFRGKLERSEVDLDNGSLKEIALAFENEIRPILLKSGIGMSDLKIIAVA